MVKSTLNWERIRTVLSRRLSSERFDDTVHLAGTGLLVLAASAFLIAVAWRDLNIPGALLLGAGVVGGLTWIVAGWALWTRHPWAERFAAGAHALALVLQICFLGLWFWTLVLAVLLWAWVEKARHPRAA